MKKSKIAFEFSGTTLEREGPMYMWTFTYRTAVGYVEFRRRWNQLLTNLKRRFPDFSGIRVFEQHTGGKGCPSGMSWGLHVHVVTNGFFRVQEIRKLCNSNGWGRIHVARIEGKQWLYLGKYLSKKRPESLKGWRLWSAFGCFEHTRCKDILVESFWTRIYRYLEENIENFAEWPWWRRSRMVAIFYRDWGISGVDIVNGQKVQDGYYVDHDSGQN